MDIVLGSILADFNLHTEEILVVFALMVMKADHQMIACKICDLSIVTFPN